MSRLCFAIVAFALLSGCSHSVQFSGSIDTAIAPPFSVNECLILTDVGWRTCQELGRGM